MTIKLSETQLEHNKKVEGGFIPFLLPALAAAGKFLVSSALHTVATGALAGLASSGASKIVDKISGLALYLRKGGSYKIIPHASGLYVRPYQKDSGITGEGLFLKSGSGFVSISYNSELSKAISNVPLIGQLLSMLI